MSTQASEISSPLSGGVARRGVHWQQFTLAGLLSLEILIFSVTGRNFFTWANCAEIMRLSAEIGLLALAQTAVILTGGIDLSVGSLLGLCAVVFGKCWRDAGMPVEVAALVAIAVGALGGLVNATLITRMRIAPLIVTLGSYSLYRGVAVAITRGAENYTGFPPRFLYLGQGFIGGVLPAQAVLLAAVAIVFWLLVHRSAAGRVLSAIGYAPEQARYAGLAVNARISLVYVLSGVAAALAALVYVAHFGQAKADAGTQFELKAITAVVLGGTSIFGGLASVGGTILGLLAIVVLQNGLTLSDQPSEWAGILTGLLLLAAIGLDRKIERPKPAQSAAGAEEFEMSNAQLAALCAVILIAALVVTGGNWLLVNSIRSQPISMSSTSTAPGAAVSATPAATHFTIAMMPKSKGNANFIAVEHGAELAAKELGVNLLWDGPTETDAAKQNEIVENWITRGVDVIAVSVENKDGLSTALRAARAHGIKVITYDADAQPDARDFFVNQATPKGIGDALTDDASDIMGGKGDFAIITATLTAANQNEWIKFIKLRLAEKYPDIHLVTIQPCDDLPTKAFDQAKTILNAYPSVKLLMAITTQGVPAAADAVKQSGRTDVKVTGLGLPSENKKWVHDGVTPNIVFWNSNDLGYLTVYAADALKAGTLKPGSTSMDAGHLGKVSVEGDNVMLGKPFIFTKDNIDQFNF